MHGHLQILEPCLLCLNARCHLEKISTYVHKLLNSTVHLLFPCYSRNWEQSLWRELLGKLWRRGRRVYTGGAIVVRQGEQLHENAVTRLTSSGQTWWILSSERLALLWAWGYFWALPCLSKGAPPRFILMSRGIFLAFMSVHHVHMPGAWGVQKKTMDSLELEWASVGRGEEQWVLLTAELIFSPSCYLDV